MKNIPYIIVLLLLIGCKPEKPVTSASNTLEFKKNDETADLIHNPMRPDGTIDSSHLPVITWKDTIYDFGTIQEGDSIRHEFRFTNTGTASLLIAQASSTCGCTIPEWPKEPVAPGQSASINVKFNSLHRTGSQLKEVTIFANTFPNRSVIRLQGRVIKK